MRAMSAKRWMEAGASAALLALLLYAGWRGTWLPLQLACAVPALRWLLQRAPLLLAAWLALALWPNGDE